MASAQTRLEELQLVHCSFLPGESMEFTENPEFWGGCLSGATELNTSDLEMEKKREMATFTVKVDGKPVWLQVSMCMRAEGHLTSVKGDNLSRSEQEKWQRIIREKEGELEGTEFPLYNLLSQLLPMLHETQLEKEPGSTPDTTQGLVDVHDEPLFHVLFTSHHLVSPKKRKSLQQWTSSLQLSGFAKVGYPGVIYAQGRQGNLEEFTANVKSMQWLALKVRFVEPVPNKLLESARSLSGWQEFSRVGEVVEEMKRIGREEFVLEMGIGSVGGPN